MKKTKRYSTKILVTVMFASLFLSFVGCESLYETFPKDELLEEDYWKNKADVEAAVITGYYDLRRCQDELIMYGLVRSDISMSFNSEFWNYQKGIFSSENKICNWSRWYKLIQDMNVVLVKAEEVKKLDAGYTDQIHNQFMAEAKFLRAFAYFNLIRMWKNVPIVDQPSLTDNQDYFPKKSENPQEVIDFILADLDFATKNMVREYNILDNPELSASMTRGRATAGAAWALLSDVYLWNNNYEGCIAACDKILESDLYYLMGKERWWDIFAPQKGNTAEAIFELNYDENFDFNDRRNNSRYTLALEDWFKSRIYAQPISGIWEQPDMRYFTLTGSGLRNVRKHVGADWSGNALVGENMNPNWIIWRLPHIIFNKAEALNRAQGSAALPEINRLISPLEQRAGVLQFETIEGSVKEVEELILDYKLKETAFEGTRWFDLVRIGKRQWADNITGTDNLLVKSLTEAALEGDKLFVQGNLNNPEAWYIPISRTELEANTNLVQNPYYINN